jgi:hypothetical protein
MSDIIPASRLSVNGYRPGIDVGVQGGIDPYFDRPVEIDVSGTIAGTTKRICRHAETCLGSGVAGTHTINVNDGSLLVVGNVFTAPAVNRVIIFVIATPSGGASTTGTINITINGTTYPVSVTAGQSANSILYAIRDALPGGYPIDNNPYFNDVLYGTLTFYFKDATISGTIDVTFGATGCTGYGFVQTGGLSSFSSEITAIVGNVVTVADLVGTNFINVALSVDNSAVMTLALAQLTSGNAAYIPPGLYVLSTGFTLNGAEGSDRTIRGAGSFVESKSGPITIGTGTKVFTVRAGLAYEAGIGVRIETRRLSEAQLQWWPERYMMGRVVSYSGTTLTVNITQTSGSGTFSDWWVSLTCFIWDGLSGVCAGLGGANSDKTIVGQFVSIVGTPLRGATSLTVASGMGVSFTVGRIIRVLVKNRMAAADLAAGKLLVISPSGYDRCRGQTLRVTNVTGDVVSFEPKLLFDLDADLAPQVYQFTGAPIERSGLENFAIRGRNNTSPGALMGISGALNCWAYDIDAKVTSNYGVGLFDSIWCEFKHVRTGFRKGPYIQSNGAGLLTGGITSCAVLHFSSLRLWPDTEINFATMGCLFFDLNCDGSANTNHGPQNSFNVFEASCIGEFKSDGYFGGEDHRTIFRCHVLNARATTFPLSDPVNGQALIIDRRFSRNFNHVLNMLGKPGVENGGFNMGKPRIGAETWEGDVTPSAGICWPDLAIGYVGVVTTRVSDNECFLTMSADAGNIVPDTSGNTLCLMMWANGALNPDGAYGLGAIRSNMTLYGYGAGGTWRMLGINGAAGDLLPAAGTTIRIWPGQNGFPEFDHDVEATALLEGNLIAHASGGATQQPVTSGAVQIASLAFPLGPPPDWPVEMTWPPYNVTLPNWDETSERTPGEKLLTNGDGYLPATGTPPDAPTLLTATTVSASQINLAWTDNTAGANGHKVYKGTVSGSLTLIATLAVGVTTYSAIGLTGSTEYFFVVRSYALGGAVSDPSNEASDTTDPGAAPTAPSGLTATAISSTQINLAWTDNSSDETAMKVLHGTSSGSLTLLQTLSAGVTVYSHTGLTPSTTHLYAIKATNANGDSVASGEASATTSGAGGQAIPTLRSARARRRAIRGS